MIRMHGLVQEVCVRSVCVAAATVALLGCSQTAQPPTINHSTAMDSPQRDMAVVVISAQRVASR